MTAGIPGTGVGGIFYLLLAFAMPAVELLRALFRTRHTRRMWLIFRQTLMAALMVASVTFTSWLIAQGCAAVGVQMPFNFTRITQHTRMPIPFFFLIVALANLALIVAAVNVLRLIVARPPVNTPGKLAPASLEAADRG